MSEKQIRVLSLFSNVGIAETYFQDIGVQVCIANELDEKRARFYSEMHPQTDMICGDITKDEIKTEILQKAKQNDINVIMATPPCQGMSAAGKRNPFDERNTLICHVVNIVHDLKPEYIFLENVTELYKTYIIYKSEEVLITEYLKAELSDSYHINFTIINTADFGVPQSRKRAIVLLSRKDMPYIWNLPEKESVVTLRDIIGNLPSLDPELSDRDYQTQLEMFPDFEKKKKAGLKVSKYHYPPKMSYRHAYVIMHTKEDHTALRNIDEFRPRKPDGSFVRGYFSSYKRQAWDKPAYTITMHNGSISSQNNGHPGRYIGQDENGYDIYSDARVLTLYELFLATSLPSDWNPPEWASDNFIRCVIGEGIPPLFVKKVFLELRKNGV